MSTPVLAAVERSGLVPRPDRVATPRHYVMCPPTYFEVAYVINPWMDASRPVDRERATRQWAVLRATYESLGHTVELLEPVVGLADMVFAANGAFVVNGRALGARFRESVRAAEAAEHRRWLSAHGIHVTPPTAVNEGEGDFAWAYGRILAASGFRAERAAQAELESTFGLPVVGLDLVDPRFYHLDTALAVLDAETVAYFEGAFSTASQQVLADIYPDAITVSEAEAAVLALNAVSDGRHVVLPIQAPRFAAMLGERGFDPVPVDMSELLAAGGGIKCTTLELHSYRGLDNSAHASARTAAVPAYEQLEIV